MTDASMSVTVPNFFDLVAFQNTGGDVVFNGGTGSIVGSGSFLTTSNIELAGLAVGVWISGSEVTAGTATLSGNFQVSPNGSMWVNETGYVNILNTAAHREISSNDARYVRLVVHNASDEDAIVNAMVVGNNRTAN